MGRVTTGSPVYIFMGSPGRKYAGKSKRDLQDRELRLLNQMANLKLDSKRARQRLESAGSVWRLKYELSQVEEALLLEEIIQFPAPLI